MLCLIYLLQMCVLGKHSGETFSCPVGRTWQMLKTTQGHRTSFSGHRCHTGHEHLVYLGIWLATLWFGTYQVVYQNTTKCECNCDCIARSHAACIPFVIQVISHPNAAVKAQGFQLTCRQKGVQHGIVFAVTLTLVAEPEFPAEQLAIGWTGTSWASSYFPEPPFSLSP